MADDVSPAPTDYETPETPKAPARHPGIWAPLVLVALFWIVEVVTGGIELTTLEKFGSRLIAGALLLIAFLVWWLFRSRTPWRERWLTLAAFIAINGIGERSAHTSLHGMSWLIFVTPIGLTAAALLWIAVRRWPSPRRFAALAIVLLGISGAFDLIRMEGLSGEHHADLALRWSKTREQRYLERLGEQPARNRPAATQPAGPVLAGAGDWTGFRGPGRDGVSVGYSVAMDWNASPPRLVWRIPVGPGWSSPIVVGRRVFTHEQRGASEIVICRDADDGAELWVHDDPVRFDEAMSGAGPRATPTFSDGRIYALGATGLLNCLDAASGNAIWKRDITDGGKVERPMWGFASSPLIVDGHVVVYAGGEKGLLAFDAITGAPAWSVQSGVQTYTSPQLATLGGQRQILFLSDAGLIGVDPPTGRLLWSLTANAPGAPRSIQPHPISDSLVLISSETDIGTAQVEVSRQGDAWQARRSWVSRALKPSFDDFVVDGPCAYGFDGAVFCCIDLQSGKRRWREGRYDHGQVILLRDSHRLLVVSEQGEMILLRATPDGNQELGRFKAVEGKTWGHPALARGRLYVRSDQELACFELQK